MNARCSPRSVVGHHAEDEVSQFPANASSTRMSSVPREPTPVHLESGPMPANDCLRLHQNQCSLPFGPEAAQGCPKQPIRGAKARPRASLLQNGKLLPQGQILQEQIATRAKGPDKQYEQKPQQAQHGASLTRKDRRNRLHFYLTDCAADHNFGEAQRYLRSTTTTIYHYRLSAHTKSPPQPSPI